MHWSILCIRGYSTPCGCCVAAAASVLPRLGASVPRLRSRAMTDTTESLPSQNEGWNFVPPSDLSSATSLLVSVILATRCDFNLHPNREEKPVLWPDSGSCLCLKNHDRCINLKTHPSSLLKDWLASGWPCGGTQAPRCGQLPWSDHWLWSRRCKGSQRRGQVGDGGGVAVHWAQLCCRPAGKALFIPDLSNRAIENEYKVLLHFCERWGFRLDWAQRWDVTEVFLKKKRKNGTELALKGCVENPVG